MSENPPQLELHAERLARLDHDWRNFPLLVDALKRVRSILKNPDSFNVIFSSGSSPNDKETTPLNKEADPDHPLSSICVVYKLPRSRTFQYGTSNSKDALLQVYFSLSSPIQAPRKKDLQTHISIMLATLDRNGDVVPETSDQFALTVKPSLTGTKLAPLERYHTEETTRWIDKIIQVLKREGENVSPQKISVSTWTGKTGRIVQ